MKFSPCRTFLAFLSFGAVLILIGCGGDIRDGSTSAIPQPPPTSFHQPTPTSPITGVQIALASTDLSVGQNRLVFGLIDKQKGPLRDTDVELRTFYVTDTGSEGPIETAKATFRKWRVGLGGVYAVYLTFDRPGNWGIVVTSTEADGSVRNSSASFLVKRESQTPAIGSPAPRSVNKTAHDVERLEELTSDPEPTPALYSMTIADALDAGKPVLVSFVTPAYCQTATCGPQLDVVKDLRSRYEDEIEFLHVEVYDNPLEIQGGLANGRLSPTVIEWNLHSEPWTFIIEADGTISSKFEGFATEEELEEALIYALK